MSVDELISMLTRVNQLHPEACGVVQIPTNKGSLSGRLAVRVKGQRVIIEGEHA